VSFKYGQENIDRCKETYEGCTKGGKPNKYYSGAMTHRFFRNEFGWYLYTSVEVEDAPGITDSRVGGIGVDFNVNFAQLCFVDRFGNPLDEVKIKYSMYGKTTEQIDAMIGDMSRDICAFGRYCRIPVYIEDLCLEGAKNFVDKGVRYNRMLNSFPYRKFRDAVESKGKKTGVEVKAVNPRYTSLIGQFNFMRRYGLSSHGAAACVIARRGLNLDTEKMSAKHKRFLRHSKGNINLNRNTRKLWIQLHSVINNRYKFNDRIRLLYDGVL
jgi:IS605 OrfB family transposase